MNEFKGIEGGLIVFTLTTGVTGLGELQSETSDQDPCSSFETESAWPAWGALRFLPVSQVLILGESIDLGGRLISPG